MCVCVCEWVCECVCVCVHQSVWVCGFGCAYTCVIPRCEGDVCMEVNTLCSIWVLLFRSVKRLLESNCVSLISISMDGNLISLEGLRSLVNGMTANKHVLKFSWPAGDVQAIHRSAGHLPRGPREKRLFETIVACNKLRANLLGRSGKVQARENALKRATIDLRLLTTSYKELREETGDSPRQLPNSAREPNR